MNGSVLIRSGILLGLLLVATFSTFANAAITPDDDLVFDSDNKINLEVPSIQSHRSNSIFHRIKRGLWDLWGGSAEDVDEDAAASTTEHPDEESEQQLLGQQEAAEYDDDFDPQHDVDDEFDAQQDFDDYVGPEASLERKSRASGEDLFADDHPNSVGGTIDDDEDNLGSSGEYEGSATESGSDIENSNVPKPTLDVTVGESRPVPAARTYFYRVILIVAEPYGESLNDRRSEEFKHLSNKLSDAIDDLYQNSLPEARTRSKIIQFSRTSDPVMTQVSFDIESTTPHVREVRSVLDEQVQRHILGDVQVIPEGYSFRDMQDLDPRECDPETELQCRSDGKCISINARCDLVFDCNDASDERDCPSHVTSTSPPETAVTSASDFVPTGYDRPTVSEKPDVAYRRPEILVDDPEVDDNEDYHEEPARPVKYEPDGGDYNEVESTTEEVPKSGEDQAIDQEEEEEVPCRGDQTIRCRDGSKCFLDVQRCDGERDCDDNSDEEDCPPIPQECEIDEFSCDVSRCISRDQRCDFIPNCDDGSDELDCPTPPECSSNDFRCKSGQCILKDRLCDGRDDCYDRSDETNCQQVCTGDQFKCDDGTCLNGNARCNGQRDCSNGEDENQCACPSGKWPCTNGVCIDQNFVCDNHEDCLDGSDERNCPDSTRPPPTCQPHEFTCSDGECIPRSAQCDRVSDCRDSGDELDCPRRCSYGEFQCRNRACVRSDQQCDGRDDCGDRSDEDNCVPPGPVDPCPGGRDCAQELNLQTYPDDQIIKESREVVITCRDEGLIRASVRWFRADGAPLPVGSTDVNGRLEMPNVQVIDSGDYVCEAVGVAENMPGRRKVAHLTVEKEDIMTESPLRPCRDDEATCSNGECVSKTKLCDRRFDCTDGTDERGCSDIGCEPNQFKCKNKECVSKVWLCDGERDCSDGSDEEQCEAPPGSPCRYNEFQCASNNQCIVKSFHCDKENDCFDGSDEIGCVEVQILSPPPRLVNLLVGETFSITCTALGVPTPEISWRLNWGHIPAKCTTTSQNGTGTLTCPSIAIEDQGAYSCEGLNSRGWKFAVPDTILRVDQREHEDVCEKGTFNSLATRPDECISCFCFGVATECSSADLFTYQLQTPFDQFNVVSVETYPEIKITAESSVASLEVQPLGLNGVRVTDRYDDSGNSDSVLYFALPESFHGSQLKSYGGYLKYTVSHRGQGSPNSAPSVVITGNNYVLVHKGDDVLPDYETERSVRFFFGDWYMRQGSDEVVASREEIMMTLANVDNILIKLKYNDGPISTKINGIVMDTANVGNNDQGAATFVEECRCPLGYTGLSCEHCASGYARRESGRWLGQCTKEEPVVCQPGYYRDPSRNVPCQLCPCPLTNPSNQFARSCHLGSDGQPTCDCPHGYVGRRCEQCAPGYQGNPLVPGDSCRKVEQCDPHGSVSPYVDPATGVCRCKALATGRTCNQCKANTFNLAQSNNLGCVSCFCSGITLKCTSSNWYRSEIRVAFTSSVRDFSLVESNSADPAPIVDGIHLNKIDKEIIYNDFPNRGNNDVYYWQLPRIFLGDQIASYGGNLRYTVRYVPSPGGGRSINNAADVELISSNDIILRYYSRKQVEPNTAETFTVPITEEHWQRDDGTATDREHLLMALADVQAIRVKATYTTHTEEAALSSVSLDTAVPTNTGRARAVEVEECSCPAGYRGLSCEDCDVGYTRGEQGLYLGTCEPCSCNGHSSQCDPESGVCENCRDHTTGDNCEECDYGYVGDATRGSAHDCQPRNNGSECSCDPAGSHGNYCTDRQCRCKSNVEGLSCNQCRPSTFGLSANNVEGCTRCYCSGVTDQCHESPYYVSQIPTLIYDSSHGFTLTDATRRDVIAEGFDLNTATNEIGYRYPDSRNQRLFWSLPSDITGNQVKSYGGSLHITQHISTRPGAVSVKDQDVILIGNGITLFWTNPEEIQPGIPLVYNVPLVESEWTRLTQVEGLHRASRADIMTVLSNLEAILVRATHSSAMTATYISDVSLDTAISQVSNARATHVEACRCPSGYTGSSCESCATGHYRDQNDRSRSDLGACNRCPCSGNEQKCELDRSGDVKCHCLPGYTGYDCSEIDYPTTTEYPVTDQPEPKITVVILETPIQIVEVGSTVTYHCTGHSLENEAISTEWYKLSGQLPPGRSYDDRRGVLIIRDVKISDSGVYVCQVSDGINVGRKELSLTVGAAKSVKPTAVIEPRYLELVEGEPVEFRCVVSGNPTPKVSWIRVGGETNPSAVFENNVWKIAAVRKSDEAGYKCVAENSAGVAEMNTVLYVTARPNPAPIDPPSPIIDPAEWIGGPTVPVVLTCTAAPNAQVTWSRAGSKPLSRNAVQRDGVLTIYNPTDDDSGYYICTAITYEGIEITTNARITIQSVGNEQAPVVSVEPKTQTVAQGTPAVVRCSVTGQPTPIVRWTKRGGSIDSHIETDGDTLRITNPKVSDRGIYVCYASNSLGESQDSAIIKVERREAPVIKLWPETFQSVQVGGSTLLQCRAFEGIPTPTVSWAREDGRPFSDNIEQLPGGILRFTRVTVEDGGSFVCSAFNDVGSTSMVAVLEISSRPVITITPANNGPLTVRLGERVKLTCTASGQPAPWVVWSRNKHPVMRYDTESVTSSTAVYEISSVSYDDEGSYTCVATNAYGPIEERVQIRVEDDRWPEPEPPRHQNPGGSGVLVPKDIFRSPDGGRVEMRCQVHGNDEENIYIEWKRDDGQSLPQGSTVSDGILLIPIVTKAAAGVYVCEGLSERGYVLFNATSVLEIVSPPRIELDPIRQIVRPGDSPRVICRATGDQPIDIQWDAIDRPIPSTVSQSRGVLQFNGITFADAGRYVCKASSPSGTAETVAEVFVEEYQPDVPSSLRDIDTYVGNTVQLNCSLDDRSTIEWSRERGEIPTTSYKVGNVLELFQVKTEDSGRYVCRVTNENGVSSSGYINLRVNPRAAPPAPVPVPASVNVRVRASHDLVNVGDTIDIQCDASGVRDARIRWTRPNEAALPSNAKDYGTVVRLTNVVMSNSGVYRCIAETPLGTFEKDYELIIQGGNNDAPAVDTKTAPYGSKVEMYCRVQMHPPPKFEWHKLGGVLPKISRTDNDQLELLEVKAEDAGTYICRADNGEEVIELPQVLVVTDVIPNFSQAPESYISFPPLPDASLQFNIEISFKPESAEGVILYNGQSSSGTGDFFVLALVNGYPEFRFNLGSNLAVIQGHRRLTLGDWHTIKLQRDNKDGRMMVDGEGPYTGIASGRMTTLDLAEPLYVGGVPDYGSISREANVSSGFVGCIGKLTIAETQLDLVGEPLSRVGITTCETCAENPCNNNGVCQEAATENGYTCLCPAGYSGKLCNNVGQRCHPDACGTGTCVEKDDGFACSCPLGKAGSKCELDVNIEEPAFHDRGAYLGFKTPKAVRKAGKRYTSKNTGSKSRSLRKDRARQHANHQSHHVKHHTKQ